MVRTRRDKLNRVLELSDTTKFWVVVAIVLIGFVFAYAYSHNRVQSSQNSKIIAEQQEQLTYLCETVSILDVATTQQLRVARETLKREDIPLWGRIYLKKREQILHTTHDELANARSCLPVE